MSLALQARVAEWGEMCSECDLEDVAHRQVPGRSLTGVQGSSGAPGHWGVGWVPLRAGSFKARL